MIETEKRVAPLDDGPDWNFDLLETYHQEIARVARFYKLDTYPNQIEVITAEQMMDAYSSVGMPIGYQHWSFGKRFIHALSTPSATTSVARWDWPTRSLSTRIPVSPT